jgi:hypothetical protein
MMARWLFEQRERHVRADLPFPQFLSKIATFPANPWLAKFCIGACIFLTVPAERRLFPPRSFQEDGPYPRQKQKALPCGAPFFSYQF